MATQQSSPDLTTALFALASAAKGRRVARKSLSAATDVVADAILAHLRTGDTITLCLPRWADRPGAEPGDSWVARERLPEDRAAHTASAETLSAPGRQCQGAGTKLEPGGSSMLVVDGYYLGAYERCTWHDGNNQIHPLDVPELYRIGGDEHHWGDAVYPAPAELRATFASIAADVIEAFRGLLAGQGRRYGEAAEAVTKIVPR
jgi:hypothetical protein